MPHTSRRSQNTSVAKNSIEYLHLEQGNMRGEDRYKHFEMIFNRNGDSRDEILKRVNKARKSIRQLKSLLQNKKKGNPRKDEYIVHLWNV